jgi:SHS2 domain-containing protein
MMQKDWSVQVSRLRVSVQTNDAGDQELLGVKAVTYHQLFIGRKNDSWIARIFLDI